MRTSQQKLKYNKARTFHVAVVSTVSSGKSTFINALIGDELLAAEHKACTARTAAVLNSNAAQTVTSHILFTDGRYEKITDCSAVQISDTLQSKDTGIADIIIECGISGVRNIQRSLMIVDTPGVNNSMDTTHKEITTQYISAMPSGLIVFLINATQMGTNDEYALLTDMKRVLDQTPDLDIIFVLNKADELDPEKEPPEEVMQDCCSYLKEIGFGHISLYPVSSLAALLFKKALADKPMRKKELSDFTRLKKHFTTPGLSLPVFAIPDAERPWDEICRVGQERIARRELLSALENTGFPTVERAIEGMMLRQLTVKPPKVTRPGTRGAPEGKSRSPRVSSAVSPAAKRTSSKKEKG